MGLDVYAVKPGDPSVTSRAELPNPVTFSWQLPDDLDAFKAIPRGYPEGLFWPSDSDVTGFRGQVYEGWLRRELDTSLYELRDPAEVGELADAIEGWLERARAAGAATTDMGDGAPVPLVAIEVLAQFARLAATQRLWLFPDY